MPRGFRPQAQIPRDLWTEFREGLAETGETEAVVCYHIVVTAARLAAERKGRRLPPKREGRAPRVPGGSKRGSVRWPMSRDVFDEHRRLIEGAGSDVPAVIDAGIRAWLDAGCSSLTMDWPPARIWRSRRRPDAA
jgi:hypothetical protein